MSTFEFLTPQTTPSSIARRDVKKGRFDVSYHAGSLAFSLTEATEIAEIAGATIVSEIRAHLRASKKLDGTPLSRKKKWKYRNQDTEKMTETTLEERTDLTNEIIDGKYLETRPKKPRATKKLSGERYATAMENYQKAMEIYIRKSKYAKSVKKHYRYKGKQYHPNLQYRGGIYSGLMYDSIHLNKPRPTRQVNGMTVAGRVRIVCDKTRAHAIEKMGFFLYSSSARVNQKINQNIHHIFQKSITRINYDQAVATRNARIKMALVIGKILLRALIRAAAA